MRTVRTLVSVTLAAAAFAGVATPAAAQRTGTSMLAGSGLYVGLDYGTTRITGNDSSSGVGVRFGYDFSRQLAAELSYANLGEYGGGRLNAWSLSGIGRLPLSEAFDVYGRLGYARLSQSGDDFLQRNGTKLDNHWIYGLGANYALLPNIGTYVEWTRYTSDANRWTVGVNYKF